MRAWAGIECHQGNSSNPNAPTKSASDHAPRQFNLALAILARAYSWSLRCVTLVFRSILLDKKGPEESFPSGSHSITDYRLAEKLILLRRYTIARQSV